MKSLYKLVFDCGRNGVVEGIIIADDDDAKILTEHEIEVDFGEALGKHSHVYGTISKDELTKVTDVGAVVNLFEEYNLKTGYNPFTQFVTYDTAHKYFPDNEDDRTVMDCIKLIKLDAFTDKMKTNLERK